MYGRNYSRKALKACFPVVKTCSYVGRITHKIILYNYLTQLFHWYWSIVMKSGHLVNKFMPLNEYIYIT